VSIDAEPALPRKKPDWLKVRAPGGEQHAKLKATLRRLDLHTVCEEARCPNVGECWGAGTATVMVLGHTCTRGCRFCAVTTGNPRGAVDPREPEHVGRAIASLGLKYVVLTMVDRDDLLDGGADHVARTILSIKERSPDLLVESLVGDFAGRSRDVDTVLASRPDVFAHNVEVPRRLTPKIRDQRCSYDRSLDVLRYAKERAASGPLRHAKERAAGGLTKSSIMVGVGETDDEVLETMADLRAVGVDVVTIGQYLRPTEKHAAVERYVTPSQFEAYEAQGKALGFAYVASGPLVRSSYHAAEAFALAALRPETNRALSDAPPAPPEAPAPAALLISAASLVRSRR
jgi:lipoic acid synthetase